MDGSIRRISNSLSDFMVISRGRNINVKLKSTIRDSFTFSDSLTSLKKTAKNQVFSAVLTTPGFTAALTTPGFTAALTTPKFEAFEV